MWPIYSPRLARKETGNLRWYRKTSRPVRWRVGRWCNCLLKFRLKRFTSRIFNSVKIYNSRCQVLLSKEDWQKVRSFQRRLMSNLQNSWDRLRKNSIQRPLCKLGISKPWKQYQKVTRRLFSSPSSKTKIECNT